MIDIKIKKLSEEAIIPKYNHPDEDLGMDIYAIQGEKIEAGQRCMVHTGIAIQAKFKKDTIPLFEKEFKLGSYLKGTSGNASKRGIEILGGVIDEGFQGEICAIVLNTGTEPIYIKRGDKVCQLVFTITPRPTSIVEVEDFDNVSQRGTQAFGTTGVAG